MIITTCKNLLYYYTVCTLSKKNFQKSIHAHLYIQIIARNFPQLIQHILASNHAVKIIYRQRKKWNDWLSHLWLLWWLLLLYIGSLLANRSIQGSILDLYVVYLVQDPQTPVYHSKPLSNEWCIPKYYTNIVKNLHVLVNMTEQVSGPIKVEINFVPVHRL